MTARTTTGRTPLEQAMRIIIESGLYVKVGPLYLMFLADPSLSQDLYCIRLRAACYLTRKAQRYLSCIALCPPGDKSPAFRA
jgi:hypothetical protein